MKNRLDLIALSVLSTGLNATDTSVIDISQAPNSMERPGSSYTTSPNVTNGNERAHTGRLLAGNHREDDPSIDDLILTLRYQSYLRFDPRDLEHGLLLTASHNDSEDTKTRQAQCVERKQPSTNNCAK